MKKNPPGQHFLRLKKKSKTSILSECVFLIKKIEPRTDILDPSQFQIPILKWKFVFKMSFGDSTFLNSKKNIVR
jgi:hypothetical protein